MDRQTLAVDLSPQLAYRPSHVSLGFIRAGLCRFHIYYINNLEYFIELYREELPVCITLAPVSQLPYFHVFQVLTSSRTASIKLANSTLLLRVLG